jgi:hypothetical protein
MTAVSLGDAATDWLRVDCGTRHSNEILVAVGPSGHDVTLTHQHTIGIDIGNEREPVIAGHTLWLLGVCRGCQTGSQHQAGEADQDLSHGCFVPLHGASVRILTPN